MYSDHRQRCDWVSEDSAYIQYHDHEWGRPVLDEHRLFEMLTLEGAQAGLSWLTILRKRQGYREQFESFDPEQIARFNDQKVSQLLRTPDIVRHRGKIESVINNARCILNLHQGGDSLAELVWDIVGGQTRVNHWASLNELPASTTESTALSKQLKQLGFRFVGPTTCYAFMQAAGLVNDHLTHCFCHPNNNRINRLQG